MIETYIEATRRLVKTLVIKSETSAEILNDQIIKHLGAESVDINNPHSWKYYLNISGQYHFLDTVMTVTSLDTLEEIEFTVENLVQHSATREAYRYGTRYYYGLINRYPLQEFLIRGILYPVDIDVAISAPNGSVLGWEEGLVEPQEATLIRDLETWIYDYKRRWDLEAYGLVDEYYYMAREAVFYMNLVPVVLNLRLRRCRTNEVHSFHIQQYLTSKQRLDRYLPYMTLKQALYFYRNIRYIELNAGHDYMFHELIERLLTERAIPLTDLSLRVDESLDSDNYLGLIVRKKPLNTQANSTESDTMMFNTLVDKERALVYGNVLHYRDHGTAIQRRLQNSPSSILQTKNLESSMVDYSNAVPDTFESVLLRQWVYQANNGMYPVVVNFKDPHTAELRSLFSLDALIYMLYVNRCRWGIELEYVPSFVNNKFRSVRHPSVEDLLSVVPHEWWDRVRPVAKEMVANFTRIQVSYSLDMFFKQATKIYGDFITHWLTTSNTHHIEARAYVDQMFYQYYSWCWEHFEYTDQPMDEWLMKRQLPEYAFSEEEADRLVIDIIGNATGYEVDNTTRLKCIQKALLEMFKQLSSYSIQFLSEINDGGIRPVGGSFTRTNDLTDGVYGRGGFQGLIEAPVRVIDRQCIGLEFRTHLLPSLVVKDYVEKPSCFGAHVEVKSPVVSNVKITENHGVSFGTTYVWSEYPGKNPNLQGSRRLLGIEDFHRLSLEQKRQIPMIQ